ncbi:unnamed protein product [Bursaphelenchus xylophilus]|nr:unnamed protein product [Bursaphelenchus xylophilus]CAG9117957.1 unnamed protein product [Bursaphelenchus xylophilus]
MLGVPKQTVSKAVKRFRELGHDGDRPRKGRKRTVNTARNRKIIKQRAERNSLVSMRKVAKETGLARESVRRIAKEHLQLQPYKLRKGQLLTEKNKQVRLERCKNLIRRHADEKLFSIQQTYNPQNSRRWSSDRPKEDAIVPRRQYPQSLMVWAGICASGKTPLIFVEKGVKINAKVYQKDILEKVVLPWSAEHFGQRRWTFQQDSAPAHSSKSTQDWIRAHFPDFIPSKEWPPYSPDLNPLDYSIWSILEARACSKPHDNIESLKASLIKEWKRLTAEEVRAAALNFTERLKLCVGAQGGHFETT